MRKNFPKEVMFDLWNDEKKKLDKSNKVVYPKP